MGALLRSFRLPRATGVYSILSLLCFVGGVVAAPAAFAENQPPKIWGSPPTYAKLNAWYTFHPQASDAETAKRRLRFSIVNKPSWAGFSVYSGNLYGIPRKAGTWSNIRITVTDGRATASLPAFSITAGRSSSGDSGGSGGTTNRAPTISGTPPNTVVAGQAYSFRPSASDPDGDTLTFSIQNRPGWASFSTSTGTLSGTPSASQVGTYSNIVIKASDGKASASLPAFGITVTDVANGSATLSWTPPTRNTNGSTLTNLAGYRIYYGTSSGALNRTIQVSNPGIASYVISDLAPATWYFSVRAYTSTGAESAPSNVASKTIR